MLLVVDEIGYLPINRTGAMLFLKLMTRRTPSAGRPSMRRPSRNPLPRVGAVPVGCHDDLRLVPPVDLSDLDRR